MLSRIRSPSGVWIGRDFGDLSVCRRNDEAGACRNRPLRVAEEPEKERREQHGDRNQQPTGKPVSGKKTHYGRDYQQTDRVPISITNHVPSRRHYTGASRWYLADSAAHQHCILDQQSGQDSIGAGVQRWRSHTARKAAAQLRLTPLPPAIPPALPGRAPRQARPGPAPGQFRAAGRVVEPARTQVRIPPACPRCKEPSRPQTL